MFKTTITNTAQEINKLSNINIARDKLGLEESFLNYVKEFTTLDKATQQAVLSSGLLSKAQKEQIISQIKLCSSTKELTAGQIEERVATAMNSIEDAKAILNKSGLITAEELESGATIKVTTDILNKAIANGTLSKSDAAVISSALGITGVTIGETASFELLTKAVWANIKAMGKWLVTNPAGWAVLATAAITGLVKGYDFLIGRKEKLSRSKIENFNEDITKFDEEIQALEELQTKLISAKGDKSELKKIQAELNAAIGETPELINAESKAYDIANAKLKANIELKKAQKKQSQQNKINNSKDLFNNNVMEIDWHLDLSGKKMREYAEALSPLDDLSYETFHKFTQSKKYKEMSFNEQQLITEAWSYSNTYSDEWKEYWQEQANIAYDIFEDTINSYTGAGGDDFIKNLIWNMVYNGFDLSQISTILQEVINNDALQNAINSYWEGLIDPNIDSDKLLQEIQHIIQDIILKHPKLANFFNNFYEQLLSSGNIIKSETSNTEAKILSIDDFKTASETLSSVSSAFKEMSDNGYLSLNTLTSIKSAVGSSIPNWNSFQEQLLNAEAGSAGFNQAMGQLTYAVLENQLGLKGLAGADEQYIAAILRENGLLNANAIAHEMVQTAQARQEIQAKLTKSATEENVAALINNAASCGIAQNAYLELMANEIAFGNNKLNVKDKISRLNQIAVAANIAGLEIQSLNSDLTGTQKKERAAQLGISVNDKTGKKTKDKNGQEVDDWEYTYNGKTYTKFSDAEMAAESDQFIKRLNSSYADIDPSKYDFSKSTSGKNNKEETNSIQNKEETKETFNWLETVLSRVQRTIQTLSKAVSATWQSWSKRNSALALQLSETRREIALQQAAYEQYMAKAESIGLPGSYKALVQDGAFSIEDITDETLKEQIHEYQDWYEKALACRDAIDDLTDSVSSLYKTDFDNTASQFDSFLSVIEHRRSMLDAAISQTEEKGWLVSADYYSALIRTEEENLAQLADKKNSLLLSLNNAVANGAIEKYSQDWYDMCGQIDDVTLAIEEANTAMIQYGNSIRDIKWEIFDLLQERISDITSESDFLLKLFENDTLYDKDSGKLTKEGTAAMGLHGMNYDVYLAQAEKYAQEILDINKLLAADPSNQKLIERRQELIKLQQDSILAAEDEKKAIKDMIEEGINSELDALKKLIDTYIDALDSQKELFDYQKKVSKQTEEIASLQKQLSAYENDDSEEKKAIRQQMKVSLNEKQEELEETEYEKYIADQKQLLDELYLEYELILNQRLDNLDMLLTDVINTVNNNAADIRDTLCTKADDAGYFLSDSIRSIWETGTGNITQVLAAYGEGILTSGNNINTTLGNMNGNLQNMVIQLNTLADMKIQSIAASAATVSSPEASGLAGGASSPAPSSSSGSGAGGGSASEWGSWFVPKTYRGRKENLNINTSIVDRLKWKDIDSEFKSRKTYYHAMGGTEDYTGTDAQNIWMLEQMKAHGYSQGGFVADLQRTAWRNGDDVVTINTLKRGEAVLTPAQAAQFKRLVENMDKAELALEVPEILARLPENLKLSFPKYPTLTLPGLTLPAGSGAPVKNEIRMEVILPNVQGYEDFKHAMQHDKNFEKMVQAMTVGRAAGGSSLKKYRY